MRRIVVTVAVAAACWAAATLAATEWLRRAGDEPGADFH